MTVQELIDELECCDCEAEVRWRSPPGRSSTQSPPSSRRPDQRADLSGYRETPAPRVLLVEGRQTCYGDQQHFASSGDRGA